MKVDYPKVEKNWMIIPVIASLILLSLALIIAHGSPAKGYEIDLYLSTPNLVWISICSAFVIGIIILLYRGVFRSYSLGRAWILGLSVLIISRIVLLYIPFTRDYVSWWADNISYSGMVKDIVATAHIGTDNFYPITHIILAEVVIVTGIPYMTVSILSTAFISALFVLSTYLLAGVIFKNAGQRLLCTLIAASVLVAGQYNVFVAPNGWSILFLPFLFYLYLKQSSPGFRFLLIIILIMYPFFHPLSDLLVIAVLLIFALSSLLSSRAFTFKNTLTNKIFSFWYVGLEATLFAVWVFHNPMLNRVAREAWQQVTMGIGSGKMSQLGQSLNKLNVSGIDLFVLLFKLYGPEIILIVLSVIGIIFLLNRGRHTHEHMEIQNIIPLALIFLFFGALYIAYLLGLPGTQVGSGQQDRRFLGYVEILLPVFSAITFYKIYQRTKWHILTNLFIFIVLAFISVLSIVSLYPSTFNDQANFQVTKMDMTGIAWFIKERDERIGTVSVSQPPYRFSDALIGFEATHFETYGLYNNFGLLRDHFGYPEQSYLGAQYTTDRYITMTEYDRIAYTTVWKNVGRFDNNDFSRLENDPTVDKLYSNSQTKIYFIQSISS